MILKITKKYQNQNVILTDISHKGTLGRTSITFNDSNLKNGKFIKALRRFISLGIVEKLSSEYRPAVEAALKNGFPVLENTKSYRMIIPIRLKKYVNNLSSINRGQKVYLTPENVDDFKKYFSIKIRKGYAKLYNEKIDFGVDDIVISSERLNEAPKENIVESNNDYVPVTPDVPEVNNISENVEKTIVEEPDRLDSSEDKISTGMADLESESTTVEHQLENLFGSNPKSKKDKSKSDESEDVENNNLDSSDKKPKSKRRKRRKKKQTDEKQIDDIDDQSDEANAKD